MDTMRLLDYGVLAVIVLGGGAAAGKFISRVWNQYWTYFTEIAEPHRMKMEGELVETLTEIKLLLTQTVANQHDFDVKLEELTRHSRGK